MTRALIYCAIPLCWLLFTSTARADDEMKQPELVAPITAGNARVISQESAVPSNVSPGTASSDSSEVKYTLTSCAEDSEPTCKSERRSGKAEV